jgi:hypothetical protein
MPDTVLTDILRCLNIALSLYTALMATLALRVYGKIFRLRVEYYMRDNVNEMRYMYSGTYASIGVCIIMAADMYSRFNTPFTWRAPIYFAVFMCFALAKLYLYKGHMLTLIQLRYLIANAGSKMELSEAPNP